MPTSVKEQTSTFYVLFNRNEHSFLYDVDPDELRYYATSEIDSDDVDVLVFEHAEYARDFLNEDKVEYILKDFTVLPVVQTVRIEYSYQMPRG